MSYETEIDEPIKVWAFFDPSTSSGQARLFPIAMKWQRRFVKFEKLIFTGQRRKGQNRILTLVCASDTANFELEYNTVNHMWRIRKVMSME